MSEEQNPVELVIRHQDWSRMGDYSLTGMALAKWLEDRSRDQKRLQLIIEQTSMEYRRKNNGPAEMIVPEFLPYCLIRDIISLIKKNEVEIEVVICEVEKPEGI